MLVVVCASAGNPGFISEQAVDSCCQHEQPQDDPCSSGENQHKGCTNEGNPFQFCSCCIHAWIPAHQVSLEKLPHPAPANYQFSGNAFLPAPPASDFWQPPRFS